MYDSPIDVLMAEMRAFEAHGLTEHRCRDNHPRLRKKQHAVPQLSRRESRQVPNKTTIFVTIFDFSGVSFISHRSHGLIPACSKKWRASRTWYRFASF